MHGSLRAHERRLNRKPLDFLNYIYLFRLFLTLSYNLTLLAFEAQFLNSMDFLNSCKHFIRSIRLSSVHLKRACEFAIFVFFFFFFENKQGICTGV